MCRHVRASRSLPALFDGSLQLCSLLTSSQVGWLENGSSNVFHGFIGSSVKNPLSTSSLVKFVSSRWSSMQTSIHLVVALNADVVAYPFQR